MKTIVVMLVGLIALSAVLAFIERRKRRSLLKHDLNLRPKNSAHTESEIIRAQHRAVHDWNRPH